jgi:hypothetical protein
MTANTSFKIVDHLAAYPANQYDYTFPTGWVPTNENLSVTMQLDKSQFPFRNLSQIIDYGISERIITLQGKFPDDGTQYLLSACMINPRIKKLYLGSDWYVYVRGLEPRIIRDASIPMHCTHTAAFLCVDPYMYDGSDAGLVSQTFSSSTLTVPASSTLGGYCYVEPIFWITGTTTAGTIYDSRGCRLSFTPPDTGTWIVMPYFNPNVSGFTPSTAVAYKLQTTTPAKAVSTDFALDFKVEGAAGTIPFINNSSNTAAVVLDETNTNKLYGATYRYPRAEYGTTTTFTKTGFTSGTVALQYRLRRI